MRSAVYSFLGSSLLIWSIYLSRVCVCAPMHTICTNPTIKQLKKDRKNKQTKIQQENNQVYFTQLNAIHVQNVHITQHNISKHGLQLWLGLCVAPINLLLLFVSSQKNANIYVLCGYTTSIDRIEWSNGWGGNNANSINWLNSFVYTLIIIWYVAWQSKQRKYCCKDE